MHDQYIAKNFLRFFAKKVARCDFVAIYNYLQRPGAGGVANMFREEGIRLGAYMQPSQGVLKRHLYIALIRGDVHRLDQLAIRRVL